MLVFTGVRGPVKFGYLEEPLVTVFQRAAVWSAKHKVDIAVTSGNDHRHSENSLHYENLAVDLQLMPKTQSHDPLRAYLSETLGLGYDVVLETSRRGTQHIHVEWDIRQ
jgi:hypothetical protein